MSKECKPNTALVFDLLRCYTFFYGNNQFFNRYTSSQQSTHTVVDLPDDFPLISEKNTIEEYKKLINFYMKKDKNELKKLSQKIYKYANKTFTYENYRNNMYKILKETLR